MHVFPCAEKGQMSCAEGLRGEADAEPNGVQAWVPVCTECQLCL